MPLVEKLAADRTIRATKDFASWTVEGWTSYLAQGAIAAPEQAPGETPADKRESYATVLARLVEALHPTAVLADRWKADAPP